MISTSPNNPVQEAIYKRLTDDAQLMALVNGVFDEPPEVEDMPYVRIGDTLTTPDNAHGQFGRVVVTTIHVWTRARGNKPGQDIANRIGQLLDHTVDLDIEGHQTVAIRQEYDQALRDPEPGVRHHVIRYRIRTNQEE